MESYTVDAFFEGALILKQLSLGFRAGSDGVLLAAFIKNESFLQKEFSVLDVGCATGVASFCLAHRLEKAQVTGIDCQENLIALANENITLNAPEISQKNGIERLKFQVADITQPFNKVISPILQPQSFDQVMTNPPYFDLSSPSPQDERSLARSMALGSLREWIKFCVKMTRPRGYITLIYPADYMEQVLIYFKEFQMGEIIIFPLWPNVTGNERAKRVLIRGKKGVKGVTQLLAGLKLHNKNKSYTEDANTVLRQGGAITWEK